MTFSDNVELSELLILGGSACLTVLEIVGLGISVLIDSSFSSIGCNSTACLKCFSGNSTCVQYFSQSFFLSVGLLLSLQVNASALSFFLLL